LQHVVEDRQAVPVGKEICRKVWSVRRQNMSGWSSILIIAAKVSFDGLATKTPEFIRWKSAKVS
jgi:hypothetical protein